MVHHGGAGTSHAATLAGVPSVVVAHTEEQRFWGNQLRRIGTAPVPLRRHGLTARALAGRLSQVLHSDTMKDRAQAAAEAMRDEHGVATAAVLIEGTFGSRVEAARRIH